MAKGKDKNDLDEIGDFRDFENLRSLPHGAGVGALLEAVFVRRCMLKKEKRRFCDRASMF
jgi:hypothetical protein